MTASSAHFPHSETATAELAGVSLSYPKGETVLKALDWTLQPGQVVGLLGRNGCGKTTLLETLLGLREPQQGRVQLFGQDVARLDDAARARIGYVPQHSDLFENFTAAQLLAYFRSFYPRWNESRVEGLLSRWDIARDKPIRRLSGGQQQRLSIIRALAHEPDLLVLDEPVASLDPVGRRDFLRELVDQVLDRGTTVVFSTHILSDLERVAFNLAFLSEGRIALQAPLDELLEQVRAFTGTVTELAGLFARLNAQPLKRTQLEAGRERVLARLPAGVSAPQDAQAVNLEDLFAELT
ncbi:ABC-2 type transport system ATP-binding protein [Pelomonas saccharophila]|uniref:ABC-2 type transport system ATP-binding protein n=1 Tax=Roseateles saccharophilus TaxID=304 RepID=A0ABU1YNN3_ROSSA|nr:ABC transporter ATP-binding protein [Roseateles saccharophilus]MDR7270473.1 ABC-2 type transport system ATP-binding protein [Roseateles saccharophilus]